MIDDDKLNTFADIFAERFAQAESRILKDIGETLKKTGELTPSQAKKLQQMYTYGADVKKFTDEIAKASGKSLEEIERLYEKTAQEELDWSKPFYDAKGVTQIPLKENKALMSMIESMAAVTKNELANLSRTTAIGVGSGKDFSTLGDFYKSTVDQAITAVATGVSDYKSVIRDAVKDLGSGGLRVRYESGYTRRLDSAARQNILDGVRYIAQETAKRNGEEFGADGYEISAHSPCAPDHIEVQGLQLSKKEFEKLQSRLKRPIGEWNCRHIAYPIVLGVSMPANSKAELAEMERQSNEKIEIDGEQYTRYECSQIQRQLETRLRYTREEKAFYKTVGDDDLTRQATEKIRILTNKYVEVSNKAGLPTRLERTKVVVERLKFRARMPLDLQFFAKISDERLSEMVGRFKKELSADKINTKLKWHKQREHMEGTKEHLERIKRDVENNKTPASYFYKDVDINKILHDSVGKGIIDFKSSSQMFPNEYITLEKPIGKVYNIGRREYIETKRIQIKYAKDGVHVFPVKER